MSAMFMRPEGMANLHFQKCKRGINPFARAADILEKVKRARRTLHKRQSE
jgi:hypothetical protein